MFIKKTKARLQINPVECSAVSLAIILQYYGYSFSQAQLNHILEISPHGSNAANIVKGAEHFGLSAKATRRTPRELRSSFKPSIIFFNRSHFVVLEGYLLNRYYVNDPALGRYSLSSGDFVRHFSGIEISFKSNKKPVKNMDFLGFAFGISISFLFWFFSLLVKNLILSKLNEQFIFILALFIGSFFAFLCLTVLINNRRFKAYSAQFRNTVLNRLKKASPSFFTFRSFLKFSKILGENNFSKNANNTVFAGALISALFLLGLYSWWLFFYSATVLLGFLVLQVFLLNKRGFNVNLNLSSATVLDKIHISQELGYKNDLIGSCLMQDSLFFEVNKNQKNLDQLIKFSSAVVFLLGLLFLFDLSGAGVWMPSFLLGYFCLLLSILGKKNRGLEEEKNLPSNEIINELNDDEYEVKIKINSDKNSKNILEIKNASFRYPGAKKELFSKLNLKLEKNMIYGLCGAPQAGSSTLLKILGQKLLLNQGEISLCGNENNEMPPYAMIDEEAEIFAAPLIENVRLFSENYSEAQVAEALKKAFVQELFLSRYLGLLSPMQAQGKNISLGQKKRLLLARALLYSPSLILLDDFFSSLDQTTALAVIKNLKESNLCVVFNSYKAEYLSQADKIIYIDDKQCLVKSFNNLLIYESDFGKMISGDNNGRFAI